MDLDDELRGRVAFSAWRWRQPMGTVSWDWADMQPAEQQLWIDRGLGRGEVPPPPEYASADRSGHGGSPAAPW